MSQTTSDLRNTMFTLNHSDIEAWSTPYGQMLLTPEAAFYAVKPIPYQPFPQSSQAAIALMPKNRRIQQNISKGLFSWPRICREALYFAVIHPYCHLPRVDGHYENCNEGKECDYQYNHKKVMKLMILCFQVSEEAIEIVHLAETVLYVSGQKGPIFRHPKDFGKPGFFHTCVTSTMLEIPPYLSEGQMLRMRKVAINISYPVYTTWDYVGGQSQEMKVEASSIVAALRKSHCLEQVRVILNREENRAYWGDIEQGLIYEKYMLMRNLLRPLIIMANERGLKIGAEHNQDGITSYAEFGVGWLNPDAEVVIAEIEEPPTDPLVTWFNNAAVLPELKAKFATPHNQETEEMMEKNLGRCKNSEMPYELVPECRNCLKSLVIGRSLPRIWPNIQSIGCDSDTRSGMNCIDLRINVGRGNIRLAPSLTWVVLATMITWRRKGIGVLRSFLDMLAKTLRTRSGLSSRLGGKSRMRSVPEMGGGRGGRGGGRGGKGGRGGRGGRAG